MSTTALVVLVVGLVASLLIVVGTIALAGQRLGRAVGQVMHDLSRLEPHVQELQTQQAVALRELERIEQNWEHTRTGTSRDDDADPA